MNTRMILGAVLAAALLAGCADMPVRWQPTEAQKQAADLVVRDLAALKPAVPEAAEPIRAEAETAALTAQAYMGLPAQRPAPVQPANAEVLNQAAADAAKAQPTAGETAAAVLAAAQQAADTGFTLVQTLLAAGGAVAGTWSAGKIARKISGLQDKAADAQTRANATFQALGEVVGGIDRLPDEVKGQVKAAQQQSPATETLVAQAKAAAKT